MLHLSERVDFYKAQACDWPNTSSMWRKCYAPSHVVIAVSRRKETKTIKPTINKAFVAFREDNNDWL